MSTSKETAAFILDQLAPLPVRARAMFGEYGVYCDEKFVALICEDTLFLKPLPVLARHLADPEMAPPYPGAKDHYVISAELLEDRAWLQEMFVRAAEAVPLKKR